MLKKMILVGAIALLGVVAGLLHSQSSAQVTYDILLSPSPDRSGPVLLDGETVSGDIYVFTSPDDNVSTVRFFMDGSFLLEEKRAPYDLAGTKKDNTALIQIWNSGGTKVLDVSGLIHVGNLQAH